MRTRAESKGECYVISWPWMEPETRADACAYRKVVEGIPGEERDTSDVAKGWILSSASDIIDCLNRSC